MIVTQEAKKSMIIFFHNESFINVILALKYIYTGVMENISKKYLTSLTMLCFISRKRKIEWDSNDKFHLLN